MAAPEPEHKPNTNRDSGLPLPCGLSGYSPSASVPAAGQLVAPVFPDNQALVGGAVPRWRRLQVTGDSVGAADAEVAADRLAVGSHRPPIGADAAGRGVA